MFENILVEKYQVLIYYFPGIPKELKIPSMDLIITLALYVNPSINQSHVRLHYYLLENSCK